ncbi:Fimbrial subunit-like protein, partial [Bifidobacterium sp. DSM 109958]|nr:Fimbrial subunit-like protein [Bifidobacterium sp. DSM 109958]
MFIKNNGNSISVSSDGVPANSKVLSGYTVNGQSFDTLDAAVKYVNEELIGNGQLTCADPVITIDASKAVYLDTSYQTADPIDVNDPAQPLKVQFQAKKNYTENGQPAAFPENFTFRLTAVGDNAKRLLGADSIEQKVTEGATGTGTATWNALTVSNDEFNRADKDDTGTATYMFKVSEVEGSDPDITYDTTEHTVTLKVTEEYQPDQTGVTNGLTGKVYIDGATEPAKTFTSKDVADGPIPIIDITTFVNSKKSLQPVGVSLQATKHFQDEKGDETTIPADKTFTFDLTPNTDDTNAKLLAPNGVTAEVGADGKALWALPQITSDIYDKATKTNGVASFNFTASERNGGDSNITYDMTTVPVRLEVSKVEADAAAGTPAGLKVEVFVDGQPKGSVTSGKDPATLSVTNSGISFTNTKKPEDVKTSVKVTKVWTDSDSTDHSKDSVKVTLEQSTDGQTWTAVTRAEKDNPVTLNAGNQWTHTWGNLPESVNGTKVQYRVRETKVNVSGGTKYEASYSPAGGVGSDVTITNAPPTPDTYGFSFTKIDAESKAGLQGAVFELTGNGVAAQQSTSDDKGVVSFSGLPAGTYTVTETKAPTGYDLPDPAPSFTVTLAKDQNNPVFSTDDKAGLVGCRTWASGEDATKAGTCTDGLKVSNTKPKVSVSASKTWVDDGLHPSSLEVTLQRRLQGAGDDAWTDVRSETLSDANKWKTVWTGLDKYDASGKAYEYRVIEAATPGYTQAVTSSRTGDAWSFAFKNTKPTTPPPT